jgi:hypothetical protein
MDSGQTDTNRFRQSADSVRFNPSTRTAQMIGRNFV